MRLDVAFQITLVQTRVWQDKPINVLVAKFPNFPAKPGESHLRMLIGFAPWKSAFKVKSGCQHRPPRSRKLFLHKPVSLSDSSTFFSYSSSSRLLRSGS